MFILERAADAEAHQVHRDTLSAPSVTGPRPGPQELGPGRPPLSAAYLWRQPLSAERTVRAGLTRGYSGGNVTS
jgi:hypothetical protein